jgi:hypothetical protein
MHCYKHGRRKHTCNTHGRTEAHTDVDTRAAGGGGRGPDNRAQGLHHSPRPADLRGQNSGPLPPDPLAFILTSPFAFILPLFYPLPPWPWLLSPFWPAFSLRPERERVRQ